MKTRPLLAAALALAPLPACAAPALPDADPALWVVKDEDTTLYLFGTFHLLDGKQAWFNDGVKTAFDASDELVLEAILPDDPADLQPLIVKYAVDPKGATLSSKLKPEVKAKLVRQLDALGLPLPALDPLEPWFVSMTLATMSAQKIGLSGDHGAEKTLSTAAKAKGMPISELEGVEYQLALFDRMPETEQIASLDQSLDELAEIEAAFRPMLEAWSAGNPDGLMDIMDAEATPGLYKALFTDRNAKWAEWIGARLEKPGTVFIAVGAGHLAGRDSVQQLLAARGIPSERVE